MTVLAERPADIDRTGYVVDPGATVSLRALAEAVDDVLVRSGHEVVAHTQIHCGTGSDPAAPVYPGLLPLAAARRAVTELVARTRGPGWRVTLHEVATLRLFNPLADGDLLTTRVTCLPTGSADDRRAEDRLVVTARCSRGGTPIARITMRLELSREAGRP